MKFLAAPNDPSNNPYSIVVDPLGCSPTGTACASFAVYAPAYSDGTVNGGTGIYWVWSSSTGSINILSGVSTAQGGSTGTDSPGSTKGNFDNATATNFAGWTCDLDKPTQTTQAYFYLDGSSTSFTSVVASMTREAAVGTACNDGSNHGFSFNPALSGSHTVVMKVENIDTNGNVVGLVSMGSKSF